MKTRQVTEFKETEIGKIPTDWEVKQLQEISKVVDSAHITPKYSPEGYSMVRVKDIKKGFLDLKESLKVSEDVYKEFTKNHTPKRDDIVMGRVGTYGIVSFVGTDTPFCLGQNTVVIHSEINHFIYHALNSKFIQKQIEERVGGSTQKTISLKNIRELLVLKPTNVEETNQIAKILFDLEMKLENLQNQNKILEQIAQTIFKSWFVDFDGVTEFEDSELGKIPKGWEIKTIGELVDHQKGFGFKSSDYQMHGKRIIRITNLTKDSIDLQNCVFIDEKKVQEQKHQKVILNENDILITTVGSNLNHPESRVGRPIRVPTFAAGSLLNQNIVNLRCRDNDLQLFLLQNIVHQKFFDYLSARTQGSANQASITLNVIFDYSICLPINDNILKKFCIISNSIYNKINKNQILIQSLVKTHNILLPKLMSGEIRV